MNILSTREALDLINQRLQRPISKQAFHQSIVPLMIRRGDARKLSVDTAIDGEWLHAWAAYIAWREQQIDAGLLPSKHTYSIQEMEDLYHGFIEE